MILYFFFSVSIHKSSFCIFLLLQYYELCSRKESLVLSVFWNAHNIETAILNIKCVSSHPIMHCTFSLTQSLLSLIRSMIGFRYTNTLCGLCDQRLHLSLTPRGAGGSITRIRNLTNKSMHVWGDNHKNKNGVNTVTNVGDTLSSLKRISINYNPIGE